MNYIPQPLEPGRDHLDIPFYARLQYDGQGLEAFLTRTGITEKAIDEYGPNELASALQSVLYFGLIGDFTDRAGDLKLHAFRQQSTSSARATVTVRPFVDLLDSPRWQASFRKTVQRSRHGRCKTDKSTCPCKLLAWAWRCLSHYEEHIKTSTPDVKRIFLSIKVLINTLYLTVQEHVAYRGEREQSIWMPNETHDLVPLQYQNSRMGLAAQEIIRLLTDAGLCMSLARHLCTVHEWMTLYYISLMKFEQSISHQHCSESECIAYSIDKYTYTTAHTTAGCSCRAVDDLDPQKIINIIDNNKIPLVRLRLDATTGNPILDTQEATWQSKYIAFSHVWSDGLGNIDANSLPICQLQRIHRLLQYAPDVGHLRVLTRHIVAAVGRRLQMNPNGLPNRLLRRLSLPSLATEQRELFWLDTLCVPTVPGNDRGKERAIAQMDAIYAGAQQVIVLDSRLEATPIASSRYADHLVRIAASAWASRCWTLQEGALSREQQFKFNNGFIDPSRAQQSLSSAPWLFTRDPDYLSSFPVFGDGVLRSLAARFSASEDRGYVARPVWDKDIVEHYQKVLIGNIESGLRKALRSSLDLNDPTPAGSAKHEQLRFWETSCRRFASVWNALSVRATTKRDDLFPILANLLLLRASDLTAYESDAEKMRAILIGTSDVPLDLLFIDGPRHRPWEKHNDRWLLTQTSPWQLNIRALSSMKVDRSGITVPAYTLISLGASTIPPDSKAFVIDIGGAASLKVRLLRVVGDEVDLSGTQMSFILLGPHEDLFFKSSGEGPKQTRGALLRAYTSTLDAEADTASHKVRDTLVTRYDCPLVLEQNQKTTTEPYLPVVVGQVMEKHTGPVRILSDTHEDFKGLTRRPAPERFQTSVSATGFPLVSRLALTTASLVVMIVILVDAPFARLSDSEKGVGIFACLTFFPPFVGHVTSAAFLALLWQRHRGFRRLEVALLTLRAIQLAHDCIILFLYIYGLVRFRYYRWLASLGIDWGYGRSQRAWMRIYDLSDWVWSGGPLAHMFDDRGNLKSRA